MTTAASNFDALLDDDEDDTVPTRTGDLDDDADSDDADSDDSVAEAPAHVPHDGTITITLTTGESVEFPVEGTSARPNRGGYDVETSEAFYKWPWTSIVSVVTTKDSPETAEAIKAAKEAARAYYGESWGAPGASTITDSDPWS